MWRQTGYLKSDGSMGEYLSYYDLFDVYLPEGIEPQVCLGQTMVAGETIIANLASDASQVKGEIR